MKRRPSRPLFVVVAVVGLGCTGLLVGEGGAGPEDGGATTVDVGRVTMDAGAPRDVVAPTLDRGTPTLDRGTPTLDRGTPVVDTGPRPPVDSGVVPPVDVGVPAACRGGPLATPMAGCRPPTPPSTGDPRQDCVNRINQFRRECQCLPPLQRWADGEACADSQATLDQQTMTAHNGFRMRLCNSGSGQNECPGWLGWGSVESTVSGCLQQMWDEGPGDFYGPPAHGHYLNMSSTSFSRVACGFFTAGGATTATQNFQ